MSFDDPGEIERLRLELKKITAQRDHYWSKIVV